MKQQDLRASTLVCAALVLLSAASLAFPIASAGEPIPDFVDIALLDVNVTIDHHYALTRVRSILWNPGEVSTEFQASLASSDLAFITRFALEWNGTLYEAEIANATAARASYNASVQAGRSAALIESRDTKTLFVGVNVPANSTVTVYLEFEEMVYRDRGVFHYRFPLAATANKHFLGELTITGTVAGNTVTLDHDISTGSIEDLSATSFSFNARESQFTPIDDFYLNWTEEPPANAGSFIMHTSADGTTYFLHIFSPDGAGLAGAPVPKDIVFVIDRSGSMSGTKIEQARTALSGILGQLRPEDRFTIIQFDDTVGLWSASILAASADNIAAAKDWVGRLQAGGSTDIDSALRTGIEALVESSFDRAPILVFLTDGEPTAGVTSPETIRENLRARNTLGAAVFTLAFGNDADWKLLQQLALENNGKAKHIYFGLDAAEQISGFYETFATPALRDVTFSYSGDATFSPSHFPAAYAGSDLVVVGTLPPGTTSVTVSVSGNSSAGPVSFSATYDLSVTETGAFVERAWAYERVRALADQALLGNTTARDQLVSLALRYRFVTKYTSLVTAAPETSTGVRVPLSAFADYDADADPLATNVYSSSTLNQTPQAQLPAGLLTDNFSDGYNPRGVSPAPIPTESMDAPGPNLAFDDATATTGGAVTSGLSLASLAGFTAAAFGLGMALAHLTTRVRPSRRK